MSNLLTHTSLLRHGILKLKICTLLYLMYLIQENQAVNIQKLKSLNLPYISFLLPHVSSSQPQPPTS